MHKGNRYVYVLVECYALLASGSAHAKLEVRTALRYVQCRLNIYIYIYFAYRNAVRASNFAYHNAVRASNFAFTSLGRFATLANYTQ